MNTKPILAILLGDSAGIGPELVAKSIASGFLMETCRPLIIGDIRILEEAWSEIEHAPGVPDFDASVYIVSSPSEADWETANGIPMLDQNDQDPAVVEKAKVSAYCGRAVIDMFELACDLCKAGEIGGIVFAPLNKAAMIAGGCPFNSEHEMLADIFRVTLPDSELNVLDNIMTTRVTSHIPIAKVSENLSIERILHAIELAHKTAVSAGITSSRIGVSALNPHCGEDGNCGREEIDIISPAVKRAQEKGIGASGPYSADILFIRAFKGEFDAVVTMYHDQGQIALKLKGFENGVTVAAGMPYPIATPAHGTAFDIAGKGIAFVTAFENAVKLVAKMAKK